MPEEIQIQMYRSVPGLENSKMMRPAYAIEYDCIDSTNLALSLEYKGIDGLFFAGQVNGSSGYEEAAAQGLMAGINASRKIDNKEEKTHSSRVCWDEYETALLIEAFWKIEENKSSKNEVLIRLSNDLRKRAVNNGMKIDDTFRNLNGIGLQLSNISLSFFPDRPAMHLSLIHISEPTRP